MSNALRYIKDLEAAGFQRSQAEAQVQMVLDAIEGDLVTKSDLAVFKEQMDSRFIQVHSEIHSQAKETELRLLSRLSFVMVSTVSIAVAVLTWLIKI